MTEQLGSAVLELRTDDSALQDGIRRAKASARGLQDSFDKFGGRARNAGALLSVGLTAPIAAFALESVNAARESAEAAGQVEAALASMGDASGRTKAQLDALAANQMAHSLYDDDEILRKVTANLLTFGNVSGEAFDRGQQAALDMAARLGTDLQSAAIMVGKALNDPVAGLKALTRTGVQFTQQQQEQIKAMVAAGDRAGAQKIILGELEHQFKGSAQAMRDADPSAAMKQAFATFQEDVGGRILPLIPPLTNALGGMLDAFGKLPPGVQTFTMGLLATSAAIGPSLIGIGGLAKGVGMLVPLFTALGPVVATAGSALLGLLANPIVLGAAAVITGIYLAWKHWDEIKAIVAAVGAAVTGWWTANVKPVLDWVLEKLGAVVTFFRNQFGAYISQVLAAISALLRGDFSAAWAAAKQAVSIAATGVINFLETLGIRGVAAMKALYTGVKQWLQEKLGAVFDWVKGKVSAVGDAFYNLYDRVVGHSYIPDMVDEIGQHIDRLDELMVDPTLDGIDKMGTGFADLARGVLDSVHGIIGAIRSGDWAGVLSSVGQLASQIGQILAGLGAGGAGSIFSKIGGVLGGVFGGGSPVLSLISSFAGLFAKGGLIPSGSWGIVGERGPEIAIGGAGGTQVLPNSALTAGALGSQGGATVEIRVTRGEMFETQVERISGNVAVQVVHEAAPAMVDATVSETARRLARTRL